VDGLGIRIAITIVACAQAMIAAALGFAEILPEAAKVALVVLAAGLAVLSNQIPSWQSAPRAERALRNANPTE